MQVVEKNQTLVGRGEKKRNEAHSNPQGVIFIAGSILKANLWLFGRVS